MSKFFAALIVIVIAITSCSKKKEPPSPPPTVYHDNAMELLMHTKTLPDGKVVFQLEKNVFVGHDQKQHLILSTDTLPALGREMVQMVDDEDEGTSHSEAATKQYDILFKVDSLK